MIIKDCSHPSEPTVLTSHTYIDRSGRIEERTQPILQEHSLSVDVGGCKTIHFVCMNEYLPELITGHLLAEGQILSVNEIAEIEIDETGTKGRIIFSDPRSQSLKSLPSLPKRCCDIEEVFRLADAFAGEMPLHNITFAAHSCFLSYKGKIVFACEDLGRHNALDKAIGYAALHGYKPADCILYSSGRMPTDMVSKAIRAGFPVLISKGAPTAGAVELARKYGLTLICSARRDGVKIYSDGR